MSWEEEVEEITRRKAFAQKMGGAEGVERQRKRGKLTVRETRAKLCEFIEEAQAILKTQVGPPLIPYRPWREWHYTMVSSSGLPQGGAGDLL